MEKDVIKYLIEEAIEETLSEHREELAADYVAHIEKNFPELHDDLEKLAKFSILSVRSGYSPTKRLQQLSTLLKMEPDTDPRQSGDTHGVRLYIDHMLDDNKLAGQAKRWYQSTLDQLLKKNYTVPRKKRERKFKKYLEKEKKKPVVLKKAEQEKKDAEEKRQADIESQSTQSEGIKRYIDKILMEDISFLAEEVRKPFNMKIPADIRRLSDIFKNAGHQLYVVGGAVRDALIGKSPKDYDVATDAKPDRILEILSQFPEFKTMEIGKAFGVINVITPEGNEYEIATFREDIGKGRRPDAVEFTSIENDVKRRDLTINALFYDIASQEVVDYVGGIEDLEKGVVKAVGSAAERFDEDRLRILRAIRFAARMGAGLDKETEDAIKADNSLEGVSAERIRDEFLKSIKSARSVPALYRLYDSFNLWKQIFPDLNVNTWYHETKNMPVQLALLTRDNSPKMLSKKLNELKYSAVETKQVAFLNMFQSLSPENAFQLKKLWKSTRLSPADLEEFAQLNKAPKMELVKAFNEYEPSVSGEELMAQGFKGREIGQEMARLEAENFANLL